MFLIDWRWEEVKIFFAIITFIFVCGIAKIIFKRSKIISSKLPESSLLILLGILFGFIIFNLDECHTNINDDIEIKMNISCKKAKNELPQFSPTLFFFILLPPLILESSFSLHNKIFFDNIITILTFAFIGTFLTFFFLGIVLLLVQFCGLLSAASFLTPVQIFLFASFVSSVDPVAVISIFSDLGINTRIYYFVFGESLLNDGVSVVLYNLFLEMTKLETGKEELSVLNILPGLGYILFMVLGGLLIGCLFGVISSLFTKQTKKIQEVEPLIIISLAYFSYICAELFGWSGILSLIGCGLFQSHYAFRNISHESIRLVKYWVKTISSACECIIFLYLGMEIFQSFQFNNSFFCWSLFLCIIIRFANIFTLSFLINIWQSRDQKISYQEQFIMSYSGLRGGMAFSLALMVDEELFPEANMFKTTTLMIVLFTVFVQGGTIKYWVNLFEMKPEKREEIAKSETTNDAVLEHMERGIKAISPATNIKTWLSNIDKRYLKYYLIKTKVYNTMEAESECEDLSDQFVNQIGPAVIATSVYECKATQDTPHKQGIAARRDFKRALSTGTRKVSNYNFSRNSLPQENQIPNSRHKNAGNIIKEINQIVNTSQLQRSVSMETKQQIDFNKISVDSWRDIAFALEKHNEIKKRKTGTSRVSSLKDSNTNLFFVNQER